MREEGVDISENRVKYVTKGMADKIDHIYVLTKRDDCPDSILKSPKVTFWEFKDPYGTNPDYYRQIRSLGLRYDL